LKTITILLGSKNISAATLQQEVRAGGPFSEAGVRQFFERVSAAAADSTAKVIHRDKPANGSL